MPRACTLCIHPGRSAVEDALRAHLSLRTIAARWSVSKTALLRHRDRHLDLPGHADQDAPPAVQPVPRGPSPVARDAATPCAGCETSQTAADIAGLLGVDALPRCTLCRLVRRLWEDVAAQMLLQQCLPETRTTFAQVRAQAPAHLSDADLLAKLLSQVVEGCH